MAVNGKVSKMENSKGAIGFFKGLKAEFKRITWPTKKNIQKAVYAVIGFCLFYIILISICDEVFKNLFRLIFGR
jgi:preprotein translocase subunit SecE